MSRNAWIHAGLAILIALALVFAYLRHAGGAQSSSDSAASGHSLAAAWCKGCHAIDAASGGAASGAPDFAAIAGQPSTTALSLRVFLKTNHRSMPNLVLTPAQADDLVNYILSLKRN
ncbi:MAG: c-type cytochrome [Bradyrhizobium sp.]|jgi:cytochrome c